MSIIQGMASLFKEDAKNEEFFERRLKICLACPHNTINGAKSESAVTDAMVTALTVLKPILNNETQGSSGSCSKCGCYINKKVSDRKSSCPVGEWGALTLSSRGFYISALEGVEGLKKVNSSYELDLGNMTNKSVREIILVTKPSVKSELTAIRFSNDYVSSFGEVVRSMEGMDIIPLKLSSLMAEKENTTTATVLLDYGKTTYELKLKFNITE